MGKIGWSRNFYIFTNRLVFSLMAPHEDVMYLRPIPRAWTDSEAQNIKLGVIPRVVLSINPS